MNVRMTLLGALVALSLPGSPAFAEEIDGCNTDRVKRIVMFGTLGKLKAAATQIYSTGSPGPRTPAILAAIEKWSASIVNVRQVKYDEANNARYCAADFQYENQPPFEILISLIGNDTTCARAFTYKIEPLLDQPGRVYVSWRCSR